MVDLGCAVHLPGLEKMLPYLVAWNIRKNMESPLLLMKKMVHILVGSTVPDDDVFVGCKFPVVKFHSLLCLHIYIYTYIYLRLLITFTFKNEFIDIHIYIYLIGSNSII